ncbi:DegV family protein [Companilactobacillus paralimentarius DSM 13238 = JCM 10415]|uniref:DegV family protein n=3 Tax=Companilactobacillus TaxID=2767879 RepID=A0ABR5NT49_9LACO|nr:MULTISPECIES: DegV family protein [Companilactobacillus]KAE9562059.1 fatty acid-binding protein DegV [Companilactobacillus kimchii]KAE9562640.1 fatty acid-binding protein DegV [Companilactobacillus paralimentarius]KRK51329.1 DegV family protein [Companilactobacillus kimchii DSM 13961 = JCM 10707]KRL32133.1 DegV family protein [Companilactobacillus paralimentarius DSM 13238 = JCM 10415]MDR4933915.1 DegV family protein [Companilactobacillus paralimentarius]
MSKVKILTDSSVQLTPEEIEKYNISVVPLTISIDEKTYVDGVNITREKFVEEMDSSKDLPKTSQPSIGTFMDVIDKVPDDYTDILALIMTPSISGTINAARQVEDMVDRNMEVIDTEFTDRAQGFQVIRAAQMAQEGKSVEEIKQALDELRAHTYLYMGVTSIENILRGGRLSRFAGTLSTLLNINLVLTVKNNSLDIVKRGRGRKTIEKYMNNVMEEIKGLKNIKAVGISYVDKMDYVNELKAKLEEIIPDVPLLIRVTSPVIATHAGSGAFAIEFYTE